MSVTYIEDGLLLGESGPWAWFRLPTQPYEMLSGEQRESLALRGSRALTGLRDAECHLLVVPRSYSADRWARQLDARTPRPTPGWSSYLREVQSYVSDSSLTQRQVYLGVRLGTGRRRSWFQALFGSAERLMGLEDPEPDRRRLNQLQQMARGYLPTITAGHPGARPASAGELRWLVQRAQWRGIAEVPEPPSRRAWGGEALALLEGVLHNGHRGLRIDQPAGTAWVATLAFSHFPEVMQLPGNEWLYHYDVLDFEVEASVRFRVVPPREAARDVERKLTAAMDQVKHIAGTSAELPLALQETAVGARELEFAVTRGQQPLIYAWPRVVVAAPDEDELGERVLELVEAYRDFGIELVRPSGDQLSLFLEALPGDKVRVRAYEQRQAVITLAGSMYWASTDLGDQGPYIGYTIDTGRRPVHFDPLRAPQIDRPTVTAIIGSPGGGKTTAALKLAYEARLRGATVVIADPKGDVHDPRRSSDLTRLEGLGRVQVIRLDDQFEGVLDPFRIEDEPEHASVLAAVLCRQFLPPELGRRVESQLLNAATDEARASRPSMLGLITRLEDADSADVVEAARTMRSIARLPGARVCFAGTQVANLRLLDALTVIQFASLSLPEAESRPEDYTIAERLAVGLMYAVTALLRTIIDAGDPRQPKMLVLDEAWVITSTAQGKQLVNRVARLGRSKNTALLLVTQNARDLLDERVGNCISAALCFRNTDEREIRACYELLDVAASPEHIAWMRRLGGDADADQRRGECLFQDIDGRVGKVKIDLVTTDLVRAFNTRPALELPEPTAGGRGTLTVVDGTQGGE